MALCGCTGPLSTLEPAGASGAAIATLWWIMLAGATVIFVGVFGAALWALRRRQPGPVSERIWLVGGGLVFPSVVLLILLIAALVVGERLSPRGEPGVLRVAATAEQWAWVFTYPDTGEEISTRGVLHVPAGRPFEVEVTSQDVIHSFWVPRLGGKIDAIPGQTNVIRLQADRPGTYLGQCAEFCGTGHTDMGFILEAHPAEDYAAGLARAAEGAP